MPLYLYQASYTAESLAAQMKQPVDRLEVVNKQLESSGCRIVSGGYGFGTFDVAVILEAPDDTTAAAIAIAIGAGGAIKSAMTTKLLNGAQWVEALKKASSVGYQPAR